MKTDIEYAAMVMAERVIHDCNDRGARITGQEDEWNPLQDDGDSRRLEIACIVWGQNNPRLSTATRAMVDAWNFRTDAWCTGDAEKIRAAVFALAVAIGKVMEGNDNAG
jgi:hypothetical protein